MCVTNTQKKKKFEFSQHCTLGFRWLIIVQSPSNNMFFYLIYTVCLLQRLGMSHYHTYFRLVFPLYCPQVVLISLKVNPYLVLILLGALMHVLPVFVFTLSMSKWAVLSLCGTDLFFSYYLEFLVSRNRGSCGKSFCIIRYNSCCVGVLFIAHLVI